MQMCFRCGPSTQTYICLSRPPTIFDIVSMDITQNLPKSILRPCQRGKRSGRNRKRINYCKLPLPSIILANARSKNNKADKSDALVKVHHAYKNASAITETWLSDKIGDSHISIDGFNLFRADRDTNTTYKSCGGGCLWLIKK